jgi:hypothetical protein
MDLPIFAAARPLPRSERCHAGLVVARPFGRPRRPAEPNRRRVEARFETAIKTAAQRYIAVQALDADGHVLSTSPVVERHGVSGS